MHLFNLVDQLRGKLIFKWGYWAIRIGMALAFIISGLRKMPGILFTTLPETNPVGAYFKAMHDTGMYWNTIGYLQILIGVLTFFNRTIVVSSVLMMPVTINIFLISIALNMKGTPVITSMMLAGNLFLLLWHHENYMSLLQKPTYLTKKKE